MVPGDRVRLTVASKGFGAENMSALRMLVPADGVQGISDFVVETVDRAGANACPPVIVGVGIGGTFERPRCSRSGRCCGRSDRAHPRPDLAELERDLLDRVNGSASGRRGSAGVVTALAVNIEVQPTHIAGLPVAVNLGCHSIAARHDLES